MRLIIIHPGIQHAPRLANAALRSGHFKKVYLLTSILFKPQNKVFGVLRKRIKPIDAGVVIINHYLYTLLFEVSRFLYNKIIINNQNQSHNNPIYFWQQIFGYYCLARIWLNRNDCMVICFETAGWPVTKYCKKWGIPVGMDFASISHEKAKELGINETDYGIKLKLKERQCIDFALFCSVFCKESFEGRTSSKKDFVLYLGAEASTLPIKNRDKQLRLTDSDFNPLLFMEEKRGSLKPIQDDRRVGDEDKRSIDQGNREVGDEKKGIYDSKEQIKISFIANLEYRKGLDTLLDALLIYQEPYPLSIYLIGRIRKEWVETHLQSRVLPSTISLIYKAAMSQETLFHYLNEQQFNLNILPSRFDSFAMVVPETMMQGIPNIVSPFVGAGEMLDHLENSYQMPVLSAAAIIDALKWYFSLTNYEKQMLRENVLQKSKQLGWENYYIHTAKVFKKLLNPKKKLKIAFIVEFPTQFEAPFYQYIDKWIKDEKDRNKEKEDWCFHVIFNYTNQQDYHDFELDKKIGWGFDLYQGYPYFIADMNDIQNSIASIIDRECYDFIILNGYKNTYKGLVKLCQHRKIPVGLRIDAVRYNLSPLKRVLKRLYLLFAYRRFDHFFAVGSETRKYLHWLGIADHQIHYFSYVTHDDWFKEKTLEKNRIEELKINLGLKNERIILSVAKFIERESPWDILHAFKLLNDPQTALVVVGDGKDRKKLEDFAFENKHLKIIFTGYVPYPNLPYYYGLSNIFIHAAKNEPWGVSVQEAIASGCTVIASNKVGSGADLISHGQNGFIYSYHDIAELKKIIIAAFAINPLQKEKVNFEILQHWGYHGIWEQIKKGVLDGRK